MKPAKITLRTGRDRAQAARWLDACPLGYTIWFKPPTRSLDQNKYMWALLDDVADQVPWAGKKRTSDEWKALFSASLRALEFVPNLDGDGFVAFGARTSEFSPQEMSDMIELILAWGSNNGVTFTDTDTAPSGERAPEADGSGLTGARELSEGEE